MTGDRASFAFDGVGGNWDWYKNDDGLNIPIAEINTEAAAQASAESHLAGLDFRALIREKLRKAERGELIEPGDGHPSLEIVPGVKEISWGIGRAQWRLYYCEPLRLRDSRTMLGLYFSRKRDLSEQNTHIVEAGRRWTCWQRQQND